MNNAMDAALELLAQGNLSVTLRGKVEPLRPVDGFGYQLLERLTPETATLTMYRIAAKCLAPGWTKDQVFGSDDEQGLSIKEIAEVCAAAQGHLKAVDATIPNGSGPLEQGHNRMHEASPESPPSIQLAS